MVLGFLAASLFREARQPGRTIPVHFPAVSTLMKDDPVVEQGIPVGKVKRVFLDGGLAVIEVELFHRRPLAEDTRFVNLSHSLMGARQVWVVPGSSPAPMQEDALQYGVFVPSSVEFLHRAGELTEAIVRYRNAAEALLRPEGALVSAARVQEELLARARGLERLANRMDSVRIAYAADLDRFVPLFGTAQAGTHGFEARLDSARHALNRLLGTLERAGNGLDTALVATESLLAAVADSNSTAGRLLADRAPYVEMRRAVVLLDSVVEAFREGRLTEGASVPHR